MSGLYILYETASGYALFERLEADQVALQLDQVQSAITDLGKFGKLIRLKSFAPFKSAAHALENIMDVSEGIVNDTLKSFLEVNMPPQGKKSSSVQLGIGEKTLAGSVKQTLGYNCVSDELVTELLRGIRFHGEKLMKQFKDGDLEKAQLGLGHSFSRAKVKFNVNRADNMIIQSICLLDQLDKDINTFAMRVREWYGWHFPELVKIAGENTVYSRLVKAIKNKSDLSESDLPKLEALLDGDAGKSQQILDAARSSMGTDISEVDMMNIESFADRVISLLDYRKKLHGYLVSKMHTVAPNLSALIGEMVGARLISHAGSLTNLSKYPASTVQILGAEKALFRALKTKGNTPKYGLIYHSSFIGRAGQKNKGRISRFLANKCSIASRIDCFTDIPTDKFGQVMKDQVEERLKFFEEGTAPRKNADAMAEALAAIQVEVPKEDNDEEVKAGSKRKTSDDAEDSDDGKKKKKKKEKKDKKADKMELDTETASSPEKKKKKEKKKKSN